MTCLRNINKRLVHSVSGQNFKLFHLVAVTDALETIEVVPLGFWHLIKRAMDHMLGKGKAQLWREGKITLTDLVDQYGRPLTLKELRERVRA